jgi:hypothetical protein
MIPMKIAFKELERCFFVLLAHARARGLSCADATAVDMYWTTTSEDWLLDPPREPKLGVGSLHDDILELTKALADPQGITSVDFDRLASVLRLLSYQLSEAG